MESNSQNLWGSYLKADLSHEKITEESLAKSVTTRYLGGNGLGIKLLYEETKGQPDPFSKENPLIFAPGLLNGSGIPMSGKSGFWSKSPLTGIMGEGIFGGYLGAEVKKAGYDAILLKGKCSELSYLLVDENGARIKTATELAGLDTEKTEEILENRHDGRAAVIGPAGENLVRFACICGSGRQVGRTGLGAVMGWKNLKGIVVNGWHKLQSANSRQFKKLIQKTTKEFTEGEGKDAYEGYSQYGTVKWSEAASDELGVFPTKYWATGTFDRAKNLSSYAWKEHVTRNTACYGCPCRCGQVYKDIADVEYETSFSLGSNLLLGEIEDVAKANHLCDKYGVDTISMGNAIGFLMKLSEEGVIDADLFFGNADQVHDLIRKTAYRQGLGKIAAEGVKRIGEKYGREELAVHVKGLSPPAYDVRAIKGMGLGFYTSTRGADHMRSDCDGIEIGGGKSPNREGEWVVMGGDIDRFSTEGKAYVAWRENYITLFDTLGTCKLTGRSVYSLKLLSKITQAYTGLNFTGKKIYKVGERIYNLERLYNLEQRPKIKEHMHVPRQFQQPSPAERAQGNRLTKQQIQKMLKDYYDAREWDENGVPEPAKLRELGIHKG